MAAIDAAGIDSAGVRIPKGLPSVPATCAGYGYVPSNLKAKDRDRYRSSTLALYNFCVYNRQRSDELIAAANRISAVCKAKANDPQLKTLLERIAPFAKEPASFLDEENGKYHASVFPYVKAYPDLMRGVDFSQVGLERRVVRAYPGLLLQGL